MIYQLVIQPPQSLGLLAAPQRCRAEVHAVKHKYWTWARGASCVEHWFVIPSASQPHGQSRPRGHSVARNLSASLTASQRHSLTAMSPHSGTATRSSQLGRVRQRHGCFTSKVRYGSPKCSVAPGNRRQPARNWGPAARLSRPAAARLL